jgi:hypothetical protein
MGLTVERVNNAKVVDVRKFKDFTKGNIIKEYKGDGDHYIFLCYFKPHNEYMVMNLNDLSVSTVSSNKLYELVEEDSQIVY